MGAISTKLKRKSDIVEGVVCKSEDLDDNAMKEFELGPDGEKVLVVKQKGKFYAVGTKCLHYGAPLSTGALGDCRVRCPWHGACFNLKTGDIEDFPGLDSIPVYDVSVAENGDVKVKGKKSVLAANKRVKNMVRRDNKCDQTIVIIGGGAAGSSCVETLRQEGFAGRLVMITSERHLPYDRVKINKNLDIEIQKVVLRSEEFYKKVDIEILKNESVISLDTDKKIVGTNTGHQITYSKLFIACGAKARSPQMPGSDLKNVFTLRTIDEANKIYQSLNLECEVVVLGSSFVGMEAAAFCNGKVKSVTVIGRSLAPFAEVLGEEVGKRILALFESKGVRMICNSGVKEFKGADGKLTGVVLLDGSELPADVCICGIGAVFDTTFLAGSRLKIENNGAIDVNEFLETNVEGVFAGGDVTNAPVFANEGAKAFIGHWQLAQYHGHVAGLNLAEKKTALKAVPFFFSMVFGTGIRYAGYGAGFDDVLVVGDLEKMKFVAYYCKGEKVVAVSTIGSDPIAAKFAELLYNGESLSKSQAEGNKWLN